MTEIFDDWPEKYDRWFATPIGKLVRQHESELILQMLGPRSGECILDAGCGTGVFAMDLLSMGAFVVGMELSLPMVLRAREKAIEFPFYPVLGDIENLPFPDDTFDRAISVTAIEFINDAKHAIAELFRVAKPGGRIVAATLNSLSPWANRRKAAGEAGHSIFRHTIFRSPDELKGLAPVEGRIRTAIHFEKHEDPVDAERIEKHGRSQNLETGAFLVACWDKPVRRGSPSAR